MNYYKFKFNFPLLFTQLYKADFHKIPCLLYSTIILLLLMLEFLEVNSIHFQCNVNWGGELDSLHIILVLKKLEFEDDGGWGFNVWWPNIEPNKGWGKLCSGGGTGGGRTIGRRPCRCASFSLAAICFFHFVLLFWNQVLIWTSVRFKFLESSSLFDTDRYLSACKDDAHISYWVRNLFWGWVNQWVGASDFWFFTFEICFKYCLH